MGSKGPTWADQWGSGNNDYDNNYGKSTPPRKAKLGGSGSGGNKKMEDVKAAASVGFDKAKSAAVVGAKKLKSGSTIGFKWVKEKCQKKNSSSK